MHLKMVRGQKNWGRGNRRRDGWQNVHDNVSSTSIRACDVATEIQKGRTSCYDPAMCILSYRCHMPDFFLHLCNQFHPSSLHIRIWNMYFENGGCAFHNQLHISNWKINNNAILLYCWHDIFPNMTLCVID